MNVKEWWCGREEYVKNFGNSFLETGETDFRHLLDPIFLTLTHYRALGVKVIRIMTDNGSACRSKIFASLLRRLGIRHMRTRTYTPPNQWQAERIQTLLWKSVMLTPT